MMNSFSIVLFSWGESLRVNFIVKVTIFYYKCVAMNLVKMLDRCKICSVLHLPLMLIFFFFFIMWNGPHNRCWQMSSWMIFNYVINLNVSVVGSLEGHICLSFLSSWSMFKRTFWIFLLHWECLSMRQRKGLTCNCARRLHPNYALYLLNLSLVYPSPKC